MLVPVADPRRGVESLRSELDSAIGRVLDGGRYVLGPEHGLFEAELAAYLGVRNCVALASGTDALEIAMRCVGGQREYVITTANAGFYSTAAAHRAGLRVRYVDVDSDTLTLSTATLEEVLSPDVHAVVVTHLYGVMAEIDSIVELCHARGIAVVEDCAQAAGARWGGRAAGTFGDVAAFSFYPTKNLPALGDGGAIVTNDDDLARRARTLRQYGWTEKYRVTATGGVNSRLDEIQAAVLRTRLPYLDRWNERRRSIVVRYADALSPAAGRMVRLDGTDYVAHLAVMLAGDRDAVRARLNAAEIGSDVHYPIPDHRQPVWGEKLEHLQLPMTEHAAEHVLSLPCFPELTDNEVTRVCEALHEL